MYVSPEEQPTTHHLREGGLVFKFFLHEHLQTRQQIENNEPKEYYLDVGFIYSLDALTEIGGGNLELGIQAVTAYLDFLRKNPSKLNSFLAKDQNPTAEDIQSYSSSFL